MKILHTSDWHIGQRLHGQEREEEHQLFFSWLLTTINAQKIDALVVAGDIFDVGFPSNSALKHYYSFLTSLLNSHCHQVIITGGNHDYISTLEAPSQVLNALNIKVIGGACSDIKNELVEISAKDSSEKALIAAVPFLRDKDIREINAGETYNDRIEAVSNGIIQHYIQLAKLVKNDPRPVIATGHLYVQGSSVSDSERDIHIGNLAGITSDAFPSEFCYVALGHIHRPQKLNKEGTVRYSGSPIPLSFSERKDQKTVVVITLAENELKEIESIEVPSFRKLIRYTGSLQEIEKQVAQHSHQSTLEDWLEIQVEEQEMNPMLREQFEAFIEKTNKAKKGLYIIRPTLRFINNEREEKNTDTLQTINDMTPSEVFAKLLDRQKVTDQEVLKQTFEELLDLIHHQTETSN